MYSGLGRARDVGDLIGSSFAGEAWTPPSREVPRASARAETPEWASGLVSFMEGLRRLPDVAESAAAADVRAVAEGRPRPSESDPAVTVQVGSEIETGIPLTQREAQEIVTGAWADSPYAPAETPMGAEPAPTGGAALADAISEGPAGDLFARAGAPREAAPYVLGLGLALLLAQTIKWSR